jgi:hypothetical protein
LSTTKPTIEDFLPLVSKCEKRLVSISIFLSQAGRLQLTNSVFTSLPTVYLCIFKLHKTVLKQTHKFKKIVYAGGLTSMQKLHQKQLGKWFISPEIKEV